MSNLKKNRKTLTSFSKFEQGLVVTNLNISSPTKEVCELIENFFSNNLTKPATAGKG